MGPPRHLAQRMPPMWLNHGVWQNFREVKQVSRVEYTGKCW